jgi:omega-amidase
MRRVAGQVPHRVATPAESGETGADTVARSRSMSTLTVAAVQMNLAWENRPENYRRARAWAERAVSKGAQLVVLPEMFATGFSMNPTVTAEPADGPTPTFLDTLARELGVAVIGGYVQEVSGGRGANVARAVDRDGALLAEYRKTHLVGILGETEVHEAGAGPEVFQVAGAPLSAFVCYDLRFPELFRLVADSVSAMVVIASWPASRQAHWDALLVARAIENQCFVVGVNRVGEGGGLDFTGGTVVVDPLGRILEHGGDQEGLVAAAIDPDQVAAVRREFPFLADRRF